jgi:hypothetical protein
VGEEKGKKETGNIRKEGEKTEESGRDLETRECPHLKENWGDFEGEKWWR